MTTIEQVLDDHEEILWRGKPRFAPFVFPSIFAVIFGLIFAAIPFFMFMASGIIWILLLPHFWIGIIIAIGPPIYAILVHKHVEYVITGKRILVKKGLIGRDFNSIDYEKIQDVSVNVGVIDKIFGTGSIISTSAGHLQYARRGRAYSVPGNIFRSIREPYKVYKLLKKVAMDVKADIYYPTKYRPRENIGYRTKYRPHGTATPRHTVHSHQGTYHRATHATGTHRRAHAAGTHRRATHATHATHRAAAHPRTATHHPRRRRRTTHSY